MPSISCSVMNKRPLKSLLHFQAVVFCGGDAHPSITLTVCQSHSHCSLVVVLCCAGKSGRPGAVRIQSQAGTLPAHLPHWFCRFLRGAAAPRHRAVRPDCQDPLPQVTQNHPAPQRQTVFRSSRHIVSSLFLEMCLYDTQTGWSRHLLIFHLSVYTIKAISSCFF